VGKSNSGKTTLIEKIIPELKRRGYRVGIVKHAHHGFVMDQQGKDSHRHLQAGADTVMVASPGQVAMVKKSSSECLDDLVPFFSDMDILIAEGFKRDRAPKIEVYRKESHDRPACLTDETLLAVVSNTPLNASVPQFALDDIAGIIDFIVTRFLVTNRYQ
jgi:molybdopterin-guanine dinucleotide biosynthesis protein B